MQIIPLSDNEKKVVAMGLGTSLMTTQIGGDAFFNMATTETLRVAIKLGVLKELFHFLKGVNARIEAEPWLQQPTSTRK